MNSAALLDWYRAHGRRHLPWRTTRDPYRVVVSEFMLQQTQVDRVVPRYTAFLGAFPDIGDLAAARAGDVLRAWRGLGYNSRAIRLHALAQTVVREYGGVMPSERDALLALPGIGPYTAAALRAFAFDIDDVALDTNLRRIVHRTTLGLEYPRLAADAQLDALARGSVPMGNAHDWNSAMMDVGSSLCTARAPKCLLCPLREGCAAAPVDPRDLATRAQRFARRGPQEALPFEQTVRFLRGRIVDRLRDVPAGAALALEDLVADLTPIVTVERLAEIPAVAAALAREGIVEYIGDAIRLR